MLLENIELIQSAESIAEEKGIEKELVFEAIEKAISKAGKVKYGNDYDIRASIDRDTGKISLARYLEVKKSVEDNFVEISLKEAKKNGAHLPITKIIDVYYEEIQKNGGNRFDTSSLISLLK